MTTAVSYHAKPEYTDLTHQQGSNFGAILFSPTNTQGKGLVVEKSVASTLGFVVSFILWFLGVLDKAASKNVNPVPDWGS
ncbi:hypothetical protein PGT21_036259 [Puccinia graminis f. sp. tritici]|uniref:Uncharacterized protein n=1 Tax=Puccinia graminis f. sp. tritici TaxID=56615 RepID=A0A5B0Q0K1_PUCGR|nr:hypothetical protein PGT21_036259 [Puccinia graminis f. sp. tritici]